MFYEDVFKALNKAKVKYLVAGGMAVNLHGFPRMTQDLDLLVDLSLPNIRKLVRVLTVLGYKCKLPINPEDIANPALRRQWIAEKGMKVLNFYHKRIPVQEIDILITAPVQPEAALRRGVIKRAQRINVPIVAIKDLIKMKQAAGRSQDLTDIQMLKILSRIK